MTHFWRFCFFFFTTEALTISIIKFRVQSIKCSVNIGIYQLVKHLLRNRTSETRSDFRDLVVPPSTFVYPGAPYRNFLPIEILLPLTPPSFRLYLCFTRSLSWSRAMGVERAQRSPGESERASEQASDLDRDGPEPLATVGQLSSPHFASFFEPPLCYPV